MQTCTHAHAHAMNPTENPGIPDIVDPQLMSRADREGERETKREKEKSTSYLILIDPTSSVLDCCVEHRHII